MTDPPHRIGSIDMSTDTGRTFDRIDGSFTGFYAERVFPEGERPVDPLRSPRVIINFRVTFGKGSDDDDDIETLRQYANSQTPIWVDYSERYTEAQYFGYILAIKPTLAKLNIRSFNISFIEIAAWGRTYVNKIDDFILHSMDSDDDWTAAADGGSVALSTVTSGMKEGKGFQRMDGTSATGFVTLTNDLPYKFDLRRYQGFSFWLKTNSLTNFTNSIINIGLDASHYYTGTIGTVPGRVNAWHQISIERDAMTVGAGSPTWYDVDWVQLKFTLGGSYSDNIDVDSLKVMGVGQDVYLYDLDYGSLGTIGYQKKEVSDILSPLWGRYNWILSRSGSNWAQELYMVNEKRKHLPVTIHDCDEASNWTVSGGTGAAVAASTTRFINGTASMKGTTSSLAEAGTFYMQYNPTTTFDITNEELILLGFLHKSSDDPTDFDYKIRLTDTGGSYNEYNFEPERMDKWDYIVLPIDKADTTSGTLTKNSIDHIRMYLTNNSGLTKDVEIYVDDIALDYGNWAFLEIQTPNDPRAFVTQCWTGSAYEDASIVDVGALIEALSTDATATKLEVLSDKLAHDIFGSNLHFTIGYAKEQGDIHQNAPSTYGDGATDYVTPYTSYVSGCEKRVLIGFKLPAGTKSYKDSSYQAINKMRLKMNMTYEDEVTTLIT